MRIARRYVVRGRVQGVGFRFFAQDAARREALHGHVANRADGAVEVEAEGDTLALARFEATLRQGPPTARVDAVVVEDREAVGLATGFTILTGDAWT